MKGLFPLLTRLNKKFWLRVSKSTKVDVRSLCIYRIITGLFLLTVDFESFSWIGESPQAFFKPPVLSAANFFTSFPVIHFFFVIEFLLIITALFITIGFKARISTLIYIFISIIGLNFKFSFGKIDHSFIVYAVLLCMSFSGWGQHLAVVPDKKMSIDSAQKSLSLISVLLCFAFFSAGCEKTFKWINFDLNTTGTGKWLYVGYYIFKRQYFLAPFFVHLPFWCFKWMDFLAVPFELSPLFFLLTSKKAWRIWLLMAGIFHLANTLILNITFIFIIIVYLAFVNYDALFYKTKYLLSLKPVKFVVFFCLSFIVIIRIKHCLGSVSILSTFFNISQFVAVDLYITLVCWILLIIILYKNAFGKNFYQMRIKP